MQKIIIQVVKKYLASLNKAQDAVAGKANAKEEGAEHKVDLEHSVGCLRVHWTASMLFVQNFLALDVVVGGVVEETVGRLKGGHQAGT